MRKQDMDTLTTFKLLNTLGNVDVDPLNKVLVEAWDGEEYHTVFSGVIFNAWSDYSNTPGAFLKVQANASLHHMSEPSKPRSYEKEFDAAKAFEDIAKDMSLTLENNGVSIMMPPSYFAGSNYHQAHDLAQQCGCHIDIDDKTLAIWNTGSYRQEYIPVFGKDTGMIGYPTFDNHGVSFSAIYNPGTIFGGAIQIEMDAEIAKKANAKQAANQSRPDKVNSVWWVTGLAYYLESEKIDGQWAMDITASITEQAIKA